MTTTPLQCPKCRAWLLQGVFDVPAPRPCPSCGTPVQVEVFPAFFRPVQAGREGETIMAEGESACFFHPQKKAILPCEGCGRFVCSLCDCELAGRHYCPTCLEAGASKGKIASLTNARTLHDGIALSLAVVPIITIYLTLVTAPAALYMVFRYWNAPRSLVSRGRSRFVVAASVATLELVGWAVAIILLTNGHAPNN